MVIKKLRDAFNWLNEKPKRHYVLGDLFEKITDHQVKSRPENCSRAGRIVERSVTLSGAFLAVAVAATLPIPLGFALTVGVVLGGCGKIVGLLAGATAEKIVDVGVGVTRKLDKVLNNAPE